MTPPRFWHRPRGLIAALLSPLGRIYAWATRRRLARQGFRPAVPVVCIGNINAGGTGKTPTVIALASRLREMGRNPHVISRGYGGQIKSATRVDPVNHSARDTGDEPLLISAFAPVWIGHNRAQSARRAIDDGADILIMDDGLQNPDLVKDLSIVVVDARVGFGNGRVIPAGPLREPVEAGLSRADFLLSIGTPAAQAAFSEHFAEHSIPRLKGWLKPLPTGMDWTGLRCVAFAGIGHPEKFFATLRDLGADIVRQEALSDHQLLTPQLITRLTTEARLLNAQLVTTEKDAVRLPATLRASVLTLPVRLELDDLSALDQRLNALFDQAP